MGDTPRRFPEHQLRIVGVVFTIICYKCISSVVNSITIAFAKALTNQVSILILAMKIV